MKNSITNECIIRIKELRKAGKSCYEISKVVGVAHSTVYRYTIGVECEKNTQKDMIIKLLTEGKSVKEIEEISGIRNSYIRTVRSTMSFKNREGLENMKSEKTRRQKEIEIITREHEERKNKVSNYYEEQLADEIQRMEERYPFIFKFTKS